MTQTTVTMELTVARVSWGGNTKEGRYFYSFAPTNVLVYAPNTKVVIELSKDTPDSFEIFRVVSSDNSRQLTDFQRSANKRQYSFNNANTVEQLILLSVLVTDASNNGEIVNCDPQMTNVPTGGVA